MKSKDGLSMRDIWPQERDFICRPDRLKYVRRLKNDPDCVFCKSSKGEESSENLVVFKTGYSQILLNKYPYNTGHLLVTPLRHTGSLFDLSDEEHQDLMRNLRFAGRIIYQAYPAQGLNIGMNHGKVAGAGIPDHLHWHVIPRWFGDTNFFPVICETKVLPETLEESWAKIKNYVEQMKEEF